MTCKPWLDATYTNPERDIVRREATYVAPGLDESGGKEIPGFWIHPFESDLLQEEIPHESKERAGILITNGFGEGISPFQMAALLESHIEGSQDISASTWDLRRVYKAGSKAEVIKALGGVLNQVGRKYRSVRNSLMALYDDLLSFYEFPRELWRSIYSTNPIEKVIQELKRRFKPAILLPNQETAEKLAYLVCVRLNEGFQKRRLRVWLR